MTTLDAAIAGGATSRRGATADALARRPAARAPSRPTARTGRRLLLLTMVVIAVTAASATGVIMHLDVARDTDAAVTLLAHTRAAVVAATDAERAIQDELLATARVRVTAGASLDAGIEVLRASAAEAAVTITERDGALVALAATEVELGVATGSLTAAGAERATRAARIVQLQACLTGVNRALTLTAFDDRSGALRALAAVAPTCDAARVAP